MGQKIRDAMTRVNHEGKPEKQLSKLATPRQFSVAPSNKMTNIHIASTAAQLLIQIVNQMVPDGHDGHLRDGC
jgi:hypothetical protein